MRKPVLFSLLLLTAAAHLVLADSFDWDLVNKVPAGINSCIIMDYDGVREGRAWFDNEGRLVKAETVPHGKDKFTLLMTNRYGVKGELLEHVTYGEDDPRLKEMVNYRNGRIREKQIYTWTEDTFVLTTNVDVTYDGTGNIVMITRRDMSGKELSHESYSYDDDGNLTEAVIEMLDEAGQIKVRIREEFNEFGHMVLQEFRNLNQGWSYRTIYKYTYNDKGLPVKVELYDSDNQETPHWGFLLEYN